MTNDKEKKYPSNCFVDIYHYIKKICLSRGEREREGERDRGTERESVCVCEWRKKKERYKIQRIYAERYIIYNCT